METEIGEATSHLLLMLADYNANIHVVSSHRLIPYGSADLICRKDLNLKGGRDNILDNNAGFVPCHFS